MGRGRSGGLWAAALLGLGLFVAGDAAAQSDDCSDAVTQVDLNACAAEELAWADDELNAAYAEALDTMTSLDEGLPDSLSGAEESLRAAQRAWIGFRDLACEAEGYMVRGGSAEPMVVLMCKTRLTEARAEDLRTLSGGMEQ